MSRWWGRLFWVRVHETCGERASIALAKIITRKSKILKIESSWLKLHLHRWHAGWHTWKKQVEANISFHLQRLGENSWLLRDWSHFCRLHKGRQVHGRPLRIKVEGGLVYAKCVIAAVSLFNKPLLTVPLHWGNTCHHHKGHLKINTLLTQVCYITTSSPEGWVWETHFRVQTGNQWGCA